MSKRLLVIGLDGASFNVLDPLIEKGYLSIGCNPLSCTRPVQIGEDPRSGRWAGSGKTECGINSLDSANL